MGAISALSDAGGALLRNPVLFVGAMVIGFAWTFVNLVGTFVPLVPGLLYFFVEPLFAGGLLGMANEAVSGRTTFGSFWRHGKENYADLLVARLVLGVAIVASYFVVVVVVAFSVGLGSISATDPGADPTTSASGFLFAGAVVLVVGLVALVVGLAIQFYSAAIVIGDADPLASFKYSYRLFKAHPLSVVGYSLITVVTFVMVAGIGVVLFALAMGGIGTLTAIVSNPGTSNPVASPGAIAGGSVVLAFLLVAAGLVGLRTLQISFLRTYYVAYVRSVVS